jgi:hypothetical protein
MNANTSTYSCTSYYSHDARDHEHHHTLRPATSGSNTRYVATHTINTNTRHNAHHEHYNRHTITARARAHAVFIPNSRACLFLTAAPPCTATYTVSAVLVPPSVALRRYDGDVQFLISNIIRPQWLRKYRALLRRLSKYEFVDVDGDEHVRCFPRVTIGLRIDKEFSIVPELSSGGRRLSMADFTSFLRETYALPRGDADPPGPLPPVRERAGDRAGGGGRGGSRPWWRSSAATRRSATRRAW